MYDTDTKAQFLQLRAKGWSLARIANRLNVAQRTLVNWNRQEQDQIRSLQSIELEALRDKILAAREQELNHLQQELDRLESELAKRSLKYTSTEDLYRLSALLRNQIRKVSEASLPMSLYYPQVAARNDHPETRENSPSSLLDDIFGDINQPQHPAQIQGKEPTASGQ